MPIAHTPGASRRCGRPQADLVDAAVKLEPEERKTRILTPL
jgi:hypothetical protein